MEEGASPEAGKEGVVITPSPFNEPTVAQTLLLHIFKNGGSNYEMRTSAAYAALAREMNLEAEEKSELLESGGRVEPKWHNRVRWARNALHKGGFLDDSPRGIWKLSPAGIAEAKRIIQGFEHFDRLLDSLPTVVAG